jgi:hypothetical protein
MDRRCWTGHALMGAVSVMARALLAGPFKREGSWIGQWIDRRRQEAQDAAVFHSYAKHWVARPTRPWRDDDANH